MENRLFIPRFDNMSDISKNKQEFVLQDWVGKLNFKQQTGLISAIRGFDGEEGESFGCGLKEITRMVRGIILKNADSVTKFMSLKPLDRDGVVDTLVKWTENQEDWHWLNHIVMAMYTISIYHNNEYTKLYYSEICKDYARQVKCINDRLDILTNEPLKTVKLLDDIEPDLRQTYNTFSEQGINMNIVGECVVNLSEIPNNDKVKVATELLDANDIIEDNSFLSTSDKPSTIKINNTMLVEGTVNDYSCKDINTDGSTKPIETTFNTELNCSEPEIVDAVDNYTRVNVGDIRSIVADKDLKDFLITCTNFSRIMLIWGDLDIPVKQKYIEDITVGGILDSINLLNRYYKYSNSRSNDTLNIPSSMLVELLTPKRLKERTDIINYITDVYKNWSGRD